MNTLEGGASVQVNDIKTTEVKRVKEEHYSEKNTICMWTYMGKEE